MLLATTAATPTLARTFQPRYVDTANVEIGDVIRVSWNAGGIEHQRTARVHRIDEHGHNVYVFYTQEGHEIMHWIPGRGTLKVVLMSRGNNVSSLTELLGLENL